MTPRCRQGPPPGPAHSSPPRGLRDSVTLGSGNPKPAGLLPCLLLLSLSFLPLLEGRPDAAPLPILSSRRQTQWLGSLASLAVAPPG